MRISISHLLNWDVFFFFLLLLFLVQFADAALINLEFNPNSGINYSRTKTKNKNKNSHCLLRSRYARSLARTRGRDQRCMAEHSPVSRNRRPPCRIIKKQIYVGALVSQSCVKAAAAHSFKAAWTLKLVMWLDRYVELGLMASLSLRRSRWATTHTYVGGWTLLLTRAGARLQLNNMLKLNNNNNNNNVGLRLNWVDVAMLIDLKANTTAQQSNCNTY